MNRALYRKYRPLNFSDVVGQKFIVEVLKNSLISGKVSHAYLFSGPRGTGKTSLAKILAKAVNCDLLKDGNPCGKCKNCKEIALKENVDVIEIDAASNNGVDEIRELKNKINIVPTTLHYKVYIIDEVHMLSIGAFNALLKTLEEPPEHVIFILATTDVHKVPVTIISRCQCFSFKRITTEEMIEHLEKVAQKEKISIEPRVLKQIAQYSDGGMRDALGLLDQLSSYTNDKITTNDFECLNGMLSEYVLNNFIQNIFNCKIKEMFDMIEEFYSNGKDFVQITKQIIEYLRNCLVAHYVKDNNLEYNESEMLKLIQYLNEMILRMNKSDQVRIVFECGLIEFIQKNISREIIVEEKKDLEIQNMNIKEEKMLKSKFKSEIDTKKVNTHEIKQLFDIRINNTFARASKQQLNSIRESWGQLKEYIFDNQIGYLICILLDGKLRAASDETLIVSYEYDSMVEKAISYYDELKEIIEKHLNKSLHLVFISDVKWEKLRQEFISKKENGIEYFYKEEPTISINIQSDSTNVLNSIDKDVEITKTAVELFGNIVEVE